MSKSTFVVLGLSWGCLGVVLWLSCGFDKKQVGTGLQHSYTIPNHKYVHFKPEHYFTGGGGAWVITRSLAYISIMKYGIYF